MRVRANVRANNSRECETALRDRVRVRVWTVDSVVCECTDGSGVRQ